MKAAYQQIKAWTVAALLVPGNLAIAEIEASIPILPETYGSVVIGDVPGLLDKIGALASKVMPGMNAGGIKAQAGAMLGDPQLAGLPSGSGLAVVIPKQGMPYAFLEVSAGKTADYQKLLKARNLGTVEEADGLLIIGADPGSVSSARAIAPQVKETLLAGSGAPTLSGAVKVADVLKQYDSQIQGAMQGMAKKVEKAEKATSATAGGDADTIVSVFRAYYAFAKRMDTLELSIEPSGEAMAMNYGVIPVNKSSEPNAPVAADASGSDLMKLLPGNGAIRGYASFDMVGMGKLFAEIAKEIETPGETSKVNVEEITKWFEECSAAFGGSMAMNLMGDPGAPLSGAYAVTVKDEAAALKVFREMPAKMESTGFAKFYDAMGMPMKLSFKENVRKYKDTPIHELDMKMDFSRGPDEQQKRMKQLMGNMVYEVAFVDKVLVYAVKPEKIEDLIEAAKSGSNPAAKPLLSSENLPKGGQGYFDYNIGAAMLFAVSMSAKEGEKGAEQMKSMAAVVKDAPPLQVGWAKAANKYRVNVKMPADTLRAFVQAGQKAAAAAKDDKSIDAEKAPSKSTRSSGPRPAKQRSRNE
ncbi:MAG: hypothetical protein ACR2IE_02250 [Candidatus Sumerlaeaceae bacterium]